MSAAAAAPVLQVQGLSFSYPGRHVFNAWSAAFRPGLTWIRGSNGSGKSTLLKLMAGALPPLAGCLLVGPAVHPVVHSDMNIEGRSLGGGIDAALRPLDYRRAVFWCGPAAIAFDHLRPAEYFAFLRSLYPHFDAAAVQAHVAALGLEPCMGMRLSQLSTGTQRKCWLAAALAVGTAVVLLDEPLNALDSASRRYVLERLALCACDMSRAWIVASHDDLGSAGEQAAVMSLDGRV